MAVLTGISLMVWDQISSGPVLAADVLAEYERPPVLNAADILPEALLSGPRHSVVPQVINDGYVNTFIINSTYGQFTAVSNAMLEVRVQEIYALAAMAQTQASDAYQGAVEEAVDDMIEGTRNLVTDPIGTLSGAVSGVAKLFGRAGEAIVGKRSDAEDSRFESFIGFSKTKREYAYDFGVDVYSSNSVLQERLDEISWAGYAGGLSFGLVTAAVPGAAGILVTGVSTSDLMNEMFRTTSPIDLRGMNRKKLIAMGVSQDIAELFVDNAAYSPRQQTLLVSALAEMEGVGNRVALIKSAVLASDEDMAFFRQRYAQMMAGYHRNVAPLKTLASVGTLVLGETLTGKAIATPPLDYLVWTPAVALIAEDLTLGVNGISDFSAKEIWLEGTLSTLARKNLEHLGWTVMDGSGRKLYSR